MTSSIYQIANLAASLYQADASSMAHSVAKLALNLTKTSKDPIILSAGGISVGDAIRLRKSLEKERFTIPKDTKGYIVAFMEEGRFLCLLFPALYPDGMLSIHDEKDLHFLHKPQVADPHIFDLKAGFNNAEVDNYLQEEFLKSGALIDVVKSQTLLKDELLAIIEASGIKTKKFARHSFSFGRFSALFELPTLYLRVRFNPYPRMLYELAFPGSMGDVVSRNRIEVIDALRRYFDASDRGSSEEES